MEAAAPQPLTLVVAPGGRADGFKLDHCIDVIDGATARLRRSSGRLVRVLEQIVADPSVLVGRVDVTDMRKRALVVEEWGRDAGPRARPLGARAVRRAAGADTGRACRGGRRNAASPTGKLDEASGGWPTPPVRRGARRGDRVAVAMGRSAELLVALLGVWKVEPFTYPWTRSTRAE
ncbi:Amino acid adenylation domain-containing protein OS=Streptomyces alboniger OX=132473 GN=CP975_32025 PE=4 SV=1 [Streptomyces alboniger]